jgi:hypothetical protein
LSDQKEVIMSITQTLTRSTGLSGSVRERITVGVSELTVSIAGARLLPSADTTACCCCCSSCATKKTG